MIQWIDKKRNIKGFTLVELIVVIAIIGIIGAIAVPRFTNFRASSAVKADAATAQQIVSAARIQETETGEKVTGLTGTHPLKDVYMKVPDPQSVDKSEDTKWKLSGGGSEAYKVTWTPDNAGIYNTLQTVTEGEESDIQSE